jgi:hypothetical protein
MLQDIYVNTRKENNMQKYKLKDTSYQIVTYECEVEADSKEEAIKKATDWKEVSNELDHNNIEVNLVERVIL